MMTTMMMILVYDLRSSRGVGPETVRQGGRRMEHRSHIVHPIVRIPALLRRERRQPLRSDPQRFVLFLF